jgi:hypothetical protein
MDLTASKTSTRSGRVPPCDARHGLCFLSFVPSQEEDTVITINSLSRSTDGLRRVYLAFLALVVGLPALGQETAYPEVRQQRTLQNVARELKLKPKEDRKPGTFSAAASSIAVDPGMTWSDVLANNRSYLESQREIELARLASPREPAPQVPIDLGDYGTYGPTFYGYGYPARVSSARSFVAPRPAARAQAPAHRPPAVSFVGRTGGRARRPF